VQPIRALTVGGPHRPELGEDLIVKVLVDGHQEGVVIVEVDVERALCDPGLARDTGNRQRGSAVVSQ
jgi:hypothetical protein